MKDSIWVYKESLPKRNSIFFKPIKKLFEQFENLKIIWKKIFRSKIIPTELESPERKFHILFYESQSEALKPTWLPKLRPSPCPFIILNHNSNRLNMFREDLLVRVKQICRIIQRLFNVYRWALGMERGFCGFCLTPDYLIFGSQLIVCGSFMSPRCHLTSPILFSKENYNSHFLQQYTDTWYGIHVKIGILLVPLNLMVQFIYSMAIE